MAEGEQHLRELEERIGYTFQNQALLLRSLTHPSYARPGSGTMHNQRLEFLGDAILGMVLAESLFQELPSEREGTLTRYRSILVKGRQLSQLAEEIELGRYLRIGEAEAAQGGRARSSILEDAFEALIAAVYLDGGLDAVRHCILHIYGPLEQRLAIQMDVHNPKGKLQELLQPALGNESIEYRLVEETGPDHEKRFTVEVWIDGICRGRGAGNAKKLAEEEAARQALENLEDPN
ncbi:MAG TPA: ribonuclease III [Oceanipulchritudo sp.]|nr:ribonuclease III [Oceanipulchritudo sp.]